MIYTDEIRTSLADDTRAIAEDIEGDAYRSVFPIVSALANLTAAIERQTATTDDTMAGVVDALDRTVDALAELHAVLGHDAET